jgi:hypothetical protein
VRRSREHRLVEPEQHRRAERGGPEQALRVVVAVPVIVPPNRTELELRDRGRRA